jgi:hypothetical protein
MMFGPATRGTEVLQFVVPVAVPEAEAAGFDQDTLATATLSEAVPAMASGVAFVTAVGPEVGSVKATAGGIESWRTVITRDEEFPAVSVAVTVITLSPASRLIAVADHAAVPSAVPLVEVAAFDQVTAATETLSDEVPPKSTVFDDVTKTGCGVGVVMATLGTMVSKVTLMFAAELLPAVSVAVTVMEFTPSVSGIMADQLIVPVAVPLPPVAALDQVTSATATLSEAVPPRAMGPMLVAYVGDAVGALIEMAGALLS